MNWTKLALGTVVGGIFYFFAGWLVWGMLLADVYEWPEGMRALVEKSPEEFGAVFMFTSCLIWGLFLTWMMLKMGISTFQTGASTGAIVGFLTSLAFGLSLTAMMKFGTLNNSLIDAVSNGVVNALLGGLIGWLLGRK